MDELLQEFIAETRETLDALSGEIVAWEAEPADRGRLDSIFRFVHTVKGSCGFLDLPRLARLSHAAEDVLAAVRDGTRLPDTALVNAVLAIVDRIGEIVEAIDAGSSLDDSSEDLLIAALAADAEPPAPLPQATAHRTTSRSVRLNVDLLDRMMSGMSDMVLARNDLARRLRDGVTEPGVDAALQRLSVAVGDMRDIVTRTRMQKIEALFSALPRMVRDTAAEVAKTVVLTIEGSDVELDREMIEVMRDPLGHIIRNAIDHGIEAPVERRAVGKSETGRLTVSARQSGNHIIIEIADDGRGIDTARLAAKAAAQQHYSDSQLTEMDDAAKAELVFEAGLSSRDSANAISGRGVGMDVVRANVEQIGGRIELQNRPGQGLTITIHVPLTLSIISTIVIGVGDQRFALARQSIEEIVALRGGMAQIDTVGDACVATVRGRRMPLVSLAKLLGIEAADPTVLAIVATRDGIYALGVDSVLDTEELVVKPAAPVVMATGIYAGQTLPDTGLPMLLLDGAGMAAAAGLRFARTEPVPSGEAAAAEAEPLVSALLFDDLDGQRRAIVLAAVDRVETVAVDAIRWTGGRMHLALEGRVVPLHLGGDLGDRATVAVLRLTDGATEVAYAIAEASEIVSLPAAIARASGDGPIAGVVIIAREQIEVVDPHALFAGEAQPVASAPLCFLEDDQGGWMETFLKPVLTAHGYRCATRLAAGEVPAVTLTMSDGTDRMDETRVVRLRRNPVSVGKADGSIYRYDRPALMAALATRVAHGKVR